MSERTAIAWTEATWNPWHGCRKVSPGCTLCYMFTAKRRYGQDPHRVVRASRGTFTAPRRWKEPRRIFTCSWSDFFIEEADGLWRDEAWEIIQATPYHTYQILTKRPERIAFSVPWARRSLGDALGPLPAPWSHVWLGVSVETTKYYERIARLVTIPAVLRFLSLEPLLGPLPELPLAGVSWVIVGGESGPGHRPMSLAAFTDVCAQVVAAGVPLFVKQDSGLRDGRQGRIPDAWWRYKQLPD